MRVPVSVTQYNYQQDRIFRTCPDMVADVKPETHLGSLGSVLLSNAQHLFFGASSASSLRQLNGTVPTAHMLFAAEAAAAGKLGVAIAGDGGNVANERRRIPSFSRTTGSSHHNSSTGTAARGTLHGALVGRDGHHYACLESTARRVSSRARSSGHQPAAPNNSVASLTAHLSLNDLGSGAERHVSDNDIRHGGLAVSRVSVTAGLLEMESADGGVQSHRSTSNLRIHPLPAAVEVSRPQVARVLDELAVAAARTRELLRVHTTGVAALHLRHDSAVRVQSRARGISSRYHASAVRHAHSRLVSLAALARVVSSSARSDDASDDGMPVLQVNAPGVASGRVRPASPAGAQLSLALPIAGGGAADRAAPCSPPCAQLLPHGSRGNSWGGIQGYIIPTLVIGAGGAQSPTIGAGGAQPPTIRAGGAQPLVIGELPTIGAVNCPRLRLVLKGGGKTTRFTGFTAPGDDEIVVIPNSLDEALCCALYKKAASLKFDGLRKLNTQADGLRRHHQLGANGKLYPLCMRYGGETMLRLGVIDCPVFKPTLVIGRTPGKPGSVWAEHQTLHGDLKTKGTHSISAALVDKTMLWTAAKVVVKQPRRSSTVWGGPACHGGNEFTGFTALLHLYAGRGVTVQQLLDTYACLVHMAAHPAGLAAFVLQHGGQLQMLEGWTGVMRTSDTGDFISPAGHRYRTLTAVGAALGLIVEPARQRLRSSCVSSGAIEEAPATRSRVRASLRLHSGPAARAASEKQPSASSRVRTSLRLRNGPAARSAPETQSVANADAEAQPVADALPTRTSLRLRNGPAASSAPETQSVANAEAQPVADARDVTARSVLELPPLTAQVADASSAAETMRRMLAEDGARPASTEWPADDESISDWGDLAVEMALSAEGQRATTLQWASASAPDVQHLALNCNVDGSPSAVFAAVLAKMTPEDRARMDTAVETASLRICQPGTRASEELRLVATALRSVRLAWRGWR